MRASRPIRIYLIVSVRCVLLRLKLCNKRFYISFNVSVCRNGGTSGVKVGIQLRVQCCSMIHSHSPVEFLIVVSWIRFRFRVQLYTYEFSQFSDDTESFVYLITRIQIPANTNFTFYFTIPHFFSIREISGTYLFLRDPGKVAKLDFRSVISRRVLLLQDSLHATRVWLRHFFFCLWFSLGVHFFRYKSCY